MVILVPGTRITKNARRPLQQRKNVRKSESPSWIKKFRVKVLESMKILKIKQTEERNREAEKEEGEKKGYNDEREENSKK